MPSIFGRSPLGLRGLKCAAIENTLVEKRGRSPLGLRGLKFVLPVHLQYRHGRSPLGLRGLKLSPNIELALYILRRSPLGLRGLKYSNSTMLHSTSYRVAALLGCVD